MNNLFLYIVTVLIWGSTWLVINYQLGEVAPEVSVVYRYSIAAILLFGWSLLRGLKLKFGFFAHVKFLMLGLFLFSFNYIATYTAQEYISSALNAVVFTTMMWMNIINARLFFRTRIELKVYLGAMMGLAGLLVLFWPSISDVSLTDRTLVGAGLSLGGALFASLGNMVSHKAQQEGLPIIQSNAWGMLYGTLITALVALRQNAEFNFEFSASYVGSLLYLAVFGSVVAFGSYLKLLGRIGPHKAGYALVMFPVVAVLLAVMFEGLAMKPHTLLGIGLVLSGNLAILGLGTLRKLVRDGCRLFSAQRYNSWFRKHFNRAEMAVLMSLLFERKVLKERPCENC